MPRVTVIVPTLAADEALGECLGALRRQTFRDFDVIVVDNSGRGAAQPFAGAAARTRVLENAANEGFGAAVNRGARESQSEFVATINDDACASPDWLAVLVKDAAQDPKAGMWASSVRLDPLHMDSAGMLLYADGSSKQRGHGMAPDRFAKREEVLFPSGSAAMYRRALFDQTGGFDDDFFLYCEDTDLGLRARWGGWTCVYVPEAIVEHRYSHSAGRASALKAYYVERNRLMVAVKCFPLAMLVAAPAYAVARYLWHLVSLVSGRGAAGEFRKSGAGAALLPWFAVRAHLAVLWRLPRLLAKRRAIRRTIGAAEFTALARRYSIGAHEVASQ